MAGIVLDFDGVLIRSMELHAEAYRRVLAPFGIEFPDRTILLLEGATSEEILAHLLAKQGGQPDPADVRRLSDEKQKVYLALGPPKLYPGAEGFVQRVRGMVPRLGLVTGTRRLNLEKLIPELLPSFDATLTAGEYTKGKPDPEPYAKVAKALGVEPDRCAAVENAPRGVRSAVAAGYAFVVGLTTTVSSSELDEAGAHVVAHDHAAAGDAMDAWLAATSGGRRDRRAR